MEEAKALGLVREIGISNFDLPQTVELLKTAKIKPAVNQFELHPYCHDEELVKFNAENGITTAAYAPLSSLTRFKGGPVDKVVQRIAGERGVSEGRVLLAWGCKKGWVVVTVTKSEERMREYARVGETVLTDGEWEEIAEAGRKEWHRAFWGEEYKERDEERVKRRK